MKLIYRILRMIFLAPFALMLGAVSTPNVQTIGTLTAENKTFYDRTLLKRLLPNLVFYQYGQKRSLPKHEGTTINFRKFTSLSAATTALTEGVTPSGTSLTVSDLTATVAQYGAFITYSDKIDLAGIDPVVTEASELLGEQAALTIDTLVSSVVAAGTNVQYSTGSARTAVTASDVLTSTLIRKAVRTLRRNNVKPYESKSFIGIIHPDVAYDIQSDTMWQDISKYNGGEQIRDGEVGKIHGVKFIETSNAPKFADAGASSADVYATMIIGSDAYGVVELEGNGAPEIIVKDRGSAGAEDPLNQRGTIGWKTCFTAVRLNEDAMVRIEHSATA